MSLNFIPADDVRAIAVTKAIQTGDIEDLQAQLSEHKELVLAYIGSPEEARTLLHILTDWPGHFPNNAAVAQVLLEAGCKVDVQYIGKLHSETPLHWTASCDDLEIMDILLDAGANINAGGGVIADTPLADARAFLQLKCAHRLVERGAMVSLQDAATLGLLDRVKEIYAESPKPTERDGNCAFWNACHGSQLGTAQFLDSQGADVNFIPPWGEDTPLDEAKSQNAADLVKWLESLGAKGKDALSGD
ncbi:ankyrin [Cordyceps militaris]|uniref:Ankyrin n=1 Tax=Cordyceps militaris TaxID=73501 RepID=A0A2H4SM55_CORMI|nr:ankyrin [Cordyceps militaris]